MKPKTEMNHYGSENKESLRFSEDLKSLNWQKTVKEVMGLVLLDDRLESVRRESFELVKLVFQSGIKKNFPKNMSALETGVSVSEKVNILMKLMTLKIKIVDLLMKDGFDEKIVEGFSRMDNGAFYDQFVAPLVVLYLQDK